MIIEAADSPSQIICLVRGLYMPDGAESKEKFSGKIGKKSDFVGFACGFNFFHISIL